jgi:hypothetical protein
MEEQFPPTPARVALKWGLILGIATIVYSVILFMTDNIGNRELGFISYALIIVGIILAMREFRGVNAGYMTYGEGLTVGTLTAAISGLLGSLFSVFYTTVIDTGFMERMMEKTREQLEEQGKMSDEQIDQSIEIMQKFQTPGLLFIFGLLGTVLMGLLFSLIIAAFMRRNKANPFD